MAETSGSWEPHESGILGLAQRLLYREATHNKASRSQRPSGRNRQPLNSKERTMKTKTKLKAGFVTAEIT